MGDAYLMLDVDLGVRMGLVRPRCGLRLPDGGLCGEVMTPDEIGGRGFYECPRAGNNGHAYSQLPDEVPLPERVVVP